MKETKLICDFKWYTTSPLKIVNTANSHIFIDLPKANTAVPLRSRYIESKFDITLAINKIFE